MKILGLVIFVIYVVTATNARFYKHHHMQRRFTYDSNGFHNGHNMMYHHHQRFGPPPPFGGPPPMPFPFHHHNHYQHNHNHGPYHNCNPDETFGMHSLYPNSKPIKPYIPSSQVFPPINPYTFNEFPSHLDPTFPHNPFFTPNQPNFGIDSTNTVNNPVNNPFDQAFNQFFYNQFGGGFPNTQQNTNTNVGTDSKNTVNTPSNGPVNTTPNNFNTVTPLDANTLFDNQNGVQSSTAPTLPEFITIDGNEQIGNGGWFQSLRYCVCKNL